MDEMLSHKNSNGTTVNWSYYHPIDVNMKTIAPTNSVIVLKSKYRESSETTDLFIQRGVMAAYIATGNAFISSWAVRLFKTQIQIETSYNMLFLNLKPK